MTPWTLSNLITQSGEAITHIPWDSAGLSVLSQKSDINLNLISPIYHIANSSTGARRTKTWFLYLTNFNFTKIPDTIIGLKVKIISQRFGRTTDDTIQLMFNDTPVGENKANFEVADEKIYGGDTDLWGITADELKSMINHESFGLSIRMQSHPTAPHNTPLLINSVSIRLLGDSVDSIGLQEEDLPHPAIGSSRWGGYEYGPGREGKDKNDSFTNANGGFLPGYGQSEVNAPGDNPGGYSPGGLPPGYSPGGGGGGGGAPVPGDGALYDPTDIFYISSFNYISDISLRPTVGPYTYYAVIVGNTNDIYYWKRSQWVQLPRV